MSTATFEREGQALDALAKANETRQLRAVLKRDLKAGRMHLAGVLLEPPAWLETAKLYHLLMSLPKWGDFRASKAMARAGVPYGKRVGSLTARQCEALIGEIERQPERRRNPRKPSLPKRQSGNCSSCGIRLRAGSVPGKCGFCIGEANEGASA